MQNLATTILSKAGRALGLALFGVCAVAKSSVPAPPSEAPQQSQSTASRPPAIGSTAAQQAQPPRNQSPQTEAPQSQPSQTQLPQTPPPPDQAAAGQNQVATFKIGSNEVNVVFTGTGKQGRHITNPKQEEFLDGNDHKAPLEVRGFHREIKPAVQGDTFIC